MVSTLVFDIDSPTMGQRFAAGQFFGVGGTALVENVGLPTFTITGVELQLQDTPAVRAWFAGGLVQDLVLVFSLSGTTPAWS
jgi:hypothetical protein